ncbi:unnamed protein product [Paramecium octaurelia]|uniref:Protein kinase domain-containing protein n=1 Tax=Paramecium octaurelia TaxID=43137 RepID=A0A8S1VTV0_PAROT|nr:unnamed protein product [Paramecium octaurelia]
MKVTKLDFKAKEQKNLKIKFDLFNSQQILFTMELQVKEYISSLLKTQILENLTLKNKDKYLQHSTGFICFLQGYSLEIGYSVQPNINEAISHYLYGVKFFADPLCAFQLEQYYTKHKNNILASFCKYLYYLLIELVYEIKHSLKKVECQKYQDAVSKLAPTSDIPLNQMSNFLQALFLFRETESQQHYDQLLMNYEQMGNKIYAHPILIKQFTLSTKNPNKCPDIMYKLCSQVNPEFFFKQCLFNISLYGMIDDSYLNSIRQVILELSFLNRTENYAEVIKQLHIKGTEQVIHKLLIFQNRVKTQKEIELKSEEIKLIGQQNSLITLYILGKRQKNRSKNCFLCKAKLLLKNPWPESPFIIFVYMFYQAKLELHHQNHDGYTKLIDQNIFEECKRYYDRNAVKFNQARTLQFFSIRRRLDKQRDKITFKNKEIQSMFDQKRVQQLDLSRDNFLAIQQTQIELRRSFLNQSPQKKIIDSIKQNQSLYINSENKRLNFDRTIQGPQILHYLDDIQLQKSRFIDFENKIRYSKLNLIQQQEISEVQFISKSNRDGQISLGKYQGKVIFIKTLSCMSYDQINQYFKLVKKYFNLDHKNIRTIIGYNIEDLQEMDLSGQIRILTYKYDYNLRTFLQKNKISTKEKWHMAVQIIDAIYYLHQNEVIFCNLHPNNILIDGDTQVPVLIDFDLQFDKDYIDIKYMAKQVIEEEMPLFTEKTDIYSIGCILLYLFFGCQFQFHESHHSPTQILETLEDLNPDQSANVGFEIPPNLDGLLEKARVITLKCLNGEIELLDMLQHFYDNA